MKTNENNQTCNEHRFEDMKEENDLLLLQLHQVQEELEHYMLKKAQTTLLPSDSIGRHTRVPEWEDDRFPHVLAENERLRALVDVQRDLHLIESKNALNVRLGNLLIEGAESPTTLFGLPAKLVRFWRAYSRQSAPESLGGKGFDKVIGTYGKGGFGGVEKLIADAHVSSVIQANSYTALARHLSSSAKGDAAEAARRAYRLDPKAYRLKWLAFRLHEAGKVVEAEAMLAVLPADTQFSDSELRQTRQLRGEAKHARERKAKRDKLYVECRAQVEQKLGRLQQERDEQFQRGAESLGQMSELNQAAVNLERQKEELARQLQQALVEGTEVRREYEEALRQANDLSTERRILGQAVLELKVVVARPEGDKADLCLQHDDSSEQTIDPALEIEVVQEAKQRIEQLRLLLTAQHDEAINRVAECDRQIAELKQSRTLQEQERLVLSDRYESCAARMQAQQHEIEVLKKVEAQWVQEKSLLGAQHKEAVKLASDRIQEVETLNAARSQLEQEKLTLTAQNREATERIGECDRKIADLRQAKAMHEQERMVISVRYEESVRQLHERDQKIEELKNLTAQTELEKSLLGRQHEESVRLAIERLQELEALKGAKSQLERDKISLAARHEESVKQAVSAEHKIEAIREAKSRLEQEKLALSDRYEEAAKVVVERAQAIKSLKQSNAKLEQEKQELASQYERASILSAENLKQISSLQREVDSRQTSNAELAKRQRIMAEEMVRAESQLELVKGMLFRDAGL